MASEKIRIADMTREQYVKLYNSADYESTQKIWLECVYEKSWYTVREEVEHEPIKLINNPYLYYMNDGVYIKTSYFEKLVTIDNQEEYEKHKTSEPCTLNSWNLVDYEIHNFYRKDLIEAIELEGAKVLPSELKLENYPNCEQIVLPDLTRLDSSFKFPKLDALTHVYMPKLEKLESTHDMEYLLNLKHLYLHFARELPSDFRLYNLEGLYIGGVTDLPFDISLFRNLRGLNISGLFIVPWSSIAKLSRLVYLVAEGKVLEGDAVKQYIKERE